MSLKNLSDIEKQTLEFIKTLGEVRPSSILDKRMVGAVSTLKDKGLVEIYKRYTSPYRRKKKKFVRIRKELNVQSESSVGLIES
ncbi:MAG: hypothetical protein ACUVUE_04725 [Candidatus Bathycorpusculaceae bacterium]